MLEICRKVIQGAGLAVALIFQSATASVPSPESFIGYEVGADYKLASWKTILGYFNALDKASGRIRLRLLGPSSMGRDMIVAEISSEGNMKKLDRLLEYQSKLHDPRKISDPAEEAAILKNARTTILVNCGIHATEVASSQMAMELAYELASRNDSGTKEILDNCLIQLIVCANPDGLDLVKEWYDKYLGTEYEGGPMPWLYHKYVGHDNNRDWWLVSQRETQNISYYLYNVGYPTLLYDIHQMGNGGARFFVPPFYEPTNPNIDPLVSQSIFMIGGHMATDLAAAGKRGVLWYAIYDNWWQGGMRTTPQRHNIVGVLTEAASARVASPIVQSATDLRGHSRGLPVYTQQVNFADPWPGGKWRLRDIVEYEKIACYSLMRLGARYRDMFVRNHLALSKKQIELGRTEAPFAWIIPTSQRDPEAAIELVRSLLASGVEVHQARRAFVADGRRYTRGTIVILASQPYRLHIKDLMEIQKYPSRAQYQGGPPERPYDVAGWTAPLQMGVEVSTITTGFSADLEEYRGPAESSLAATKLVANPNSTAWEAVQVILTLQAGGVAYLVLKPFGSLGAGTIIHTGWSGASNSESLHAPNHYGLRPEWRVVPFKETLPEGALELRAPRVALYQPWTANMDEGWTRFIWDKSGIGYTSIHNADIRAGSLFSRFDCIFMPSQNASEIVGGASNTRMPAPYAGGIGEEGLAALKEFMQDGGTLVLMDGSCSLAEPLGIVVKNSLSGVGQEKFYCPGSILSVEVDNTHPVAWGMPTNSTAYFAESRAFEVPPDTKGTRVVARYGQGNPLLSGFLLGPEYIAGKPAILEVAIGKGRAILFGFRVQFRGQSMATFKYMYNAMLASVLPTT